MSESPYAQTEANNKVQIIGWTTLGIFIVLGVVAIIGGIIFGTYQAQVLGQEVKVACIQAGGTWIDYNSLCIAPGFEVKK